MDESMNTRQQLDKLNEAISKLRLGQRISSVSYDGHSVSYSGPSLAELLQEKQRLEELLAAETPGVHVKRQVIFVPHKGVRV